jgi:cytochrome P450
VITQTGGENMGDDGRIAGTTGNITFVDPAVQLCPFAAYRKLHADARVYRDPVTGFYEITGFEDLSAIAQDAATYSSEHPVYGDRSLTPAHKEVNRLYEENGYPALPTLINADEPAHRMYRNLVDASFKASRVKALEPKIRELVTKLIDSFGGRGEAEFVAEFAMLLPLYVIADTIGVTRDRAADFKRWSDAMMKVYEPGISGELQIQLTKVVIEMQQFFAAELAKAKEAPQENILGDLAVAEVEGRALTTREAVHLLSSILVAGNETTTSALGNAMRRLIATPGLQERLWADPARINDFVEETLRIDAPLQCQYRRNVREVVLHDVTIPANSMIVLRFGAGNRDELRFKRADVVDIDRPAVRPHLTFGMGIHMCLGHLLARAELRIAFELLLTRLKNLRPNGSSTALPSYMVYAPRTLPIAFDQS